MEALADGQFQHVVCWDVTDLCSSVDDAHRLRFMATHGRSPRVVVEAASWLSTSAKQDGEALVRKVVLAKRAGQLDRRLGDLLLPADVQAALDGVLARLAAADAKAPADGGACDVDGSVEPAVSSEPVVVVQGARLDEMPGSLVGRRSA